MAGTVGAIGKGSFKGFEQSASTTDPDGADDDDGNFGTDKMISTNLQSISRNIQQLKKLVDSLGTSRDSKELREKLKTIQTETHHLTKRTSTLMQRLEDNRPDEAGKLNEWKLQKQRLRETFRDLLKDYSDQQKKIKSREQAEIRESLKKSGFFDIDIDESGSLVKNGEHVEVQTLQASADLEIIKEREEDLKQLEQDIVDINDIFKQLGKMVHEQGEVIKHAEQNVEVAQVNVEVGLQELEKAKSNVDAARRKKLICILLVAGLCILVAIVIAISVVTTQKDDKTQDPIKSTIPSSTVGTT